MPNAKPPRLEQGLHEWFLQTRGARALINACDVRLGLEAAKPAQSDAAVVLGRFAGVTGNLPLLTLSRRYDDRGDPLGYAALAGDQLLPPEQRETYHQLPDFFTFKQAKQVYGKGDQATMDYLKKCILLRILRPRARAALEVSKSIRSLRTIHTTPIHHATHWTVRGIDSKTMTRGAIRYHQ